MRRLRFPRLAYNGLSFAGAIIAVVSGLLMLFLLAFESIRGGENPYVGVFVYMALPPLVLLGLFLIPIGMLRRRRRILKHGYAAPTWPNIDLNRKPHRNAFYVFVSGTLIYVMLNAVGAYQAFHFTESVSFCGKTCHEVMKPEFVAYQNSPHARVACSKCHVGSGASWYAKSKFSGIYQVYAVLANAYPRPIPTPIESLRPSQETCEQCHWPRKFFGAQQHQYNHYMYDEQSTLWPINMLVKTGGGDPKTGQTAGIHWHMNIGMRVEYIPRDERRQDIPWVKVTDYVTGRVTIYQSEEDPFTPEEIEAATPRRMDCMDCHNRPSHNFHSPDLVIDHAILTGQIDQTLPEIKRAAVEALDEDYETEEAALQNIATRIPDFYMENYPEVSRDRRLEIEQAVLAAQSHYSQNFFPEMKVRWKDYPDNIGHFIFPGCMRCHDGAHVSEDGWVITRNCNTCHAILAQGSGDRAQVSESREGLEFVHPEDIDEAWREIACYECHTGTQP